MSASAPLLSTLTSLQKQSLTCTQQSDQIRVARRRQAGQRARHGQGRPHHAPRISRKRRAVGGQAVCEQKGAAEQVISIHIFIAYGNHILKPDPNTDAIFTVDGRRQRHRHLGVHTAPKLHFPPLAVRDPQTQTRR